METHYTKSADGTSIAYQVHAGTGPTVLCVPGAVSNLMIIDMDPAAARFYERLARFGRVVRFDKRGAGLSDRNAASSTIERQVDDVEAVRIAIGTEQIVLSGLSQGAAVAVLYAARHPDRVTHLILDQGICCDAYDPYTSPDQARPLLDWDEFFGDLENDFAGFSKRLAETMSPSASSKTIEQLVAFLRISVSPQNVRALWKGIVGLDLRPLLGELRVPTLVIHCSGDRHHPVAHGRYLAEHIPGARFLELDSDLHIPAVDPHLGDQITMAVEELVTGSVRHTADRRFAAVLFADIVDSTQQQKERGDESWRASLGSWEGSMRRVAEQFSGRVVKFQGDGLMAAFTGAGDALRAANAVLSATADLGLQSRAGVHAGEAYEVEGDLFGTCVNIAARACDHAAADEVLTTTVVEGLVEGSDLQFEDRGEVDLKGIGKRRLLRMRTG